MQTGQPSQTALSAAAARAAHLVVDHEPHLFRDTLAAKLLGDLAAETIAYHRTHGDHVILSGTRALTTTRSHYTESHLPRNRPSRYIILGAGLDTFAYRTAPDRDIQVIEIDHPATQEWKRTLLASADIPIPDHLTFLPTDFESEPLPEIPTTPLPTLVSWLGVSMYLTLEAIESTIAAISRLGPGTEFIMEYALPPDLRDTIGKTYADFATQVVSDRHEPYLTFLHPDEVSTLLETHGFVVTEHVPMQATVPPHLWTRSDALRPFNFFHLTKAKIKPRT
ncbi:S-adenosyl-L-methionine-dependent methyltransferase [Actinomadura sp. NBRC 104412]|uniref:class I SAM-dependent methyltransferase n=1 Tax=Actinomadura sp. NBRC 104412 TaxID=3032203 RepID=UPI0024A0C728|nr:SAM-dependent methyltransferase [Actinomadura sp. NBRC 104412]GLZ08297.1 S-adenosyl-L-methionine-dependent methyltransferase [Actinomadura sp. NBRC 104412]